MPSARADEFRRAALRLGFRKARQTGSHERWVHEDGRSATIPIHGGQQIGSPLFYRILKQLGITASDLERLR
jgi:predicted RNA binding protein YcfA (HicA-like mRNA interferase family)